MAASTNISIVVEAIDQATKTLDKVKGELSGVGDAGKWIIDTLKQNEEWLRNLWIGAGIGFAGMTFGISKATEASTELENSMKGLRSIVEGTGNDFGKAQQFIDKFTADGLVPTADAATALKNLLSRGFSLDEASVMMDRFKDSASFGRQASLSLGDAVKSATEGIKNENSILVDNAWVTKNVSMMWDEYAKAHGKSVKDLTVAEKRQAEYNGIMEETKFQIGDAKKYADWFSGSLAQTGANATKLKASIGDALKPALNELLKAINPLLIGITNFTNAHPELVKWVTLWATAILGVTAALATIGLAIPAITTAIGTLTALFGMISAPVLAVIGVIGALALAFSTDFLGIRTMTGEFINWFSTTFWPSFSQIFGVVREIISAFWNLFSTILQKMWFDTKWSLDGIKQVFEVIFTAIGVYLTAVFGTLLQIVKTGLGFIRDTVNVVTKLIQWDWSGAWTAVKTLFANLLQGIIDTFLAWVTPFMEMVWVNREQIVAAFGAIWDGIKAITISLWDSITSYVEEKLAWLKRKVQAMKDTLAEMATLGGANTQTYNGVSGTRAVGWPVTSGKTYLVGERWPELFTPSVSGAIVPNSKLGGGGMASIVINMWGVTVQNDADENRLVQKIRDTLYSEFRGARLWL